MAPIVEGQSIGSDERTKLRGNSWFQEPRILLGSEAGSNSTIQFASNGSRLVSVNSNPRPWDGLSTQVSHPHATTFAICNLSHLWFLLWMKNKSCIIGFLNSKHG
jgi:hypothetical protein